MIKIYIPEDVPVDKRNFKMALDVTSVPVFDINDIEKVAKHLLIYVDRFRKDKED